MDSLKLLFVALLSTGSIHCGGQAQSPSPSSNSPSAAAHRKDQASIQSTSEDDALLPVDSRVRTGVLDNGLTYYVLEHKKPEKRAHLWLAVNAGSLQEDDDQQGLAHFLEHMAFNGTEKYEKSAIVDYMEGVGMKFGADLNAYTSFEQTVYMLKVPTDDQAIVDKGIDILHQWAGAITALPEEVDKERGVVTEEWRLGQGANQRVMDKQIPLLFAGSKIAERLPIGKPDILKTASRDTLYRFFQDWYRPNLMAIVAVGDFDGAKMEAEIKAKFGGLKNPENERARIEEYVPLGNTPVVSIETDPELQQTWVSIVNRMPHRTKGSTNDYRRKIVESLYHNMFRSRMLEISEDPSSPILYSYSSSSSSWVRNSDSFKRGVSVKQDKVQEGVTLLAREFRRVEMHGFTSSELKRAKMDVLSYYQRAALQRDKKDGRGFASEILRNFLSAEPMPGIEAEVDLVERFLPSIELDELNHLASAWTEKNNEIVLISGPSGLDTPTKEEVLSILSDAKSLKPSPYNDDVSDQPIIAQQPNAGTITNTKTFESIGVTEWTLSNGAKVVVKPTNFKNDEIKFTAFSPGGHSLVSDKDYFSAHSAASIANQSGLGTLNAAQLRKKLAGKVVQLYPYIGELDEGIWGDASSRDLKEFFEVLYSQFQPPRNDPSAFAAWKAEQHQWVQNRRLSPEGSFYDDMSAFISKDHLRRRPMTVERLETVDHKRALEIYTERFADASDFTFVFVGDINLTTFKPMIETYIASLPSLHRKEKWKDTGVAMPKGKKSKTTFKGVEPKSYLFLNMHGYEKSTPASRNNMDVLSQVMDIRLREVLREEMGGVYGAYSKGTIKRRPRDLFSFEVFFGCSPEKVDQLKKAVMNTMAELRTKGISKSNIEKIKSMRKRKRETNLKVNGFWSRKLEYAYTYGENPEDILDESLLYNVSSAQVKAAAKKYLSLKNYVSAVLLPENMVKK